LHSTKQYLCQIEDPPSQEWAGYRANNVICLTYEKCLEASGSCATASRADEAKTVKPSKALAVDAGAILKVYGEVEAELDLFDSYADLLPRSHVRGGSVF
jgi:hypothetical protein